MFRSLLFAIYADFFILSIISENALKPSEEKFDAIVDDDNSASKANNIINATVSPATTAIIDGIQTTLFHLLLDVDSDNDADSNKSMDSSKDDNNNTSTMIVLNPSESQQTLINRIHATGAFFCRYQTVPYKLAKVRMYSNIARVHENK
uniref:Secreted protein n=1 Tax=Elaeophora elaphi TaxID=1147741 RepID=A0A0R3S4A2_9BILA